MSRSAASLYDCAESSFFALLSRAFNSAKIASFDSNSLSLNKSKMVFVSDMYQKTLPVALANTRGLTSISADSSLISLDLLSISSFSDSVGCTLSLREKRVRCHKVLRQAADAPFDGGRFALPYTRDFMPIIIAGLLMIAATCGFIAANFDRIGDAIATSEEQP